MALEQARIGHVVTAQMEALVRDYGKHEDAEIGAVISIVEVVRPQGEELRSEVRTRFNIPDPYRVIGLMRTAEQQVLPTFRRD